MVLGPFCSSPRREKLSQMEHARDVGVYELILTKETLIDLRTAEKFMFWIRGALVTKILVAFHFGFSALRIMLEHPSTPGPSNVPNTTPFVNLMVSERTRYRRVIRSKVPESKALVTGSRRSS